MTPEQRLGRVLTRLADGTGVLRSRRHDDARATRNGTERDARLEAAVEKFEAAAQELWSALGFKS